MTLTKTDLRARVGARWFGPDKEGDDEPDDASVAQAIEADDLIADFVEDARRWRKVVAAAHDLCIERDWDMDPGGSPTVRRLVEAITAAIEAEGEENDA